MIRPETLTEEEKYKIALLSGDIARKSYPDDYLKTLCDKIGIQGEEKRLLFSQRVRNAGTQYLNLKRINTGRIPVYKQNKILDRYKKALEQAQSAYREIQESTVISSRLGAAVRDRYEQLTEQRMKEMFHPYCDGPGMAITLFENFLGELIQAAENAKHESVKNFKTDPSGEFLTGWVTAIGKYWPEDATINFALGKYDTEESIYTSPSIPILHDIIRKLEPGTSEKEIVTAIRKIKLESLLNKPVADFLLI